MEGKLGRFFTAKIWLLSVWETRKLTRGTHVRCTPQTEQISLKLKRVFGCFASCMELPCERLSKLNVYVWHQSIDYRLFGGTLSLYNVLFKSTVELVFIKGFQNQFHERFPKSVCILCKNCSFFVFVWCTFSTQLDPPLLKKSTFFLTVFNVEN